MHQENYQFGILGYGYVGRATHFSLLKNQKVGVHDTSLNTSIENLANVENIFVCLPTAGQSDIEILTLEIQRLIDLNPNCRIIIRSTLPIGTSKQIEKDLGIKVIYIPEFLRERFWEEDSQKRPLIVGHDGLKLPQWLKEEQILDCSLEEAETVKMFSNNFAVVRIAFANLFYDLSEKHGVDYQSVKNMYFKVMHDQTYMEVPGHDGSRGFGGKCLPKDLDFLINSLDKDNLDSMWFKNIRDLNKQWQKKF